MRILQSLLCVGALGGFCGGVAATATPPDYSREIRPILSEHCFVCHGPDEAAREGDLRLDLPGDVDRLASTRTAPHEFVRRITSADPEERMPPESTGKPLSAREIEQLKNWIAAGAPYTDHWAFLPPVRPQLPEIELPEAALPDAEGAAHPIDRFILARLREEGRTYSPEADRITLIRRVYFDLIGLPPTPAEVQDFLDDAHPDAYERLVDRLLASPHYGERMAVYWLDLVRYADTNGYHGDNYRSVWPYRDYVVEAFNQNMPFDQFTVEQLAGDLLPNATRQQKVASAYNRLNRITAEGGAQPKEYLAMYAADRVRTTSTTWLGVTLGCAECHDHKFDPLSTEDFYRFAAYFADLEERGVYGIGQWDPELPLPSEQQEAELTRLSHEIAELDAEIENSRAALVEEQAAWEAELRAQTTAADLLYEPHAPTKMKLAFGGEAAVLDDHSVLSQGKHHVNETYIVDLETDLAPITAIRVEALTHPSFPGASLARGNGNFVLTHFSIEQVAADPETPPTPIAIGRAEASYASEGGPIANALDSSALNGWIPDGHLFARDRHALFTFAKPLAGGPGTRLRVYLRHESIYPDHVMGRFRLSLTSAENPQLPATPVPLDVLQAVITPDGQRTEQQTQQIGDYYRTLAPRLDELRAERKAIEEQRRELTKSVPTVLVSRAVEPRTTRVLPRGNWMDESGAVVEPGPPAVLSAGRPALERRETRLDLASWLVAPENPLTARVLVNRLWKLYYGEALAPTPDDFGAQGEPPRYARLLDWLAVELVESGWDLKHLVRLMVTADCYRQTSSPPDELRMADPQNRWHARQQPLRLDAEMIRDNALAVSGLLVRELGGPSVKPYQPAGYWSQLNFPPRKYVADEGPQQYRRGLYTYWMRTFLHPAMRAFDAPSREECTVARSVSTTPLQALVLLNDPTYVEAARALAARMMTETSGTPVERVRWAYREVLSRLPGAAAEQTLVELYHQTVAAASERSAGVDAEPGQFVPPEELDRQEYTGWTAVARVLLNLHETTTRY